MKKTLVAIAVLAASSAAMAQSSVTLYGVADLWVGSVKITNNGSSTRTSLMADGGVSNSRIGFKGTEDLGGGLNVNFVLEQSVDMTNGSASGFDREAYVGLSGAFGEVKFGKAWNAFDDVSAGASSVFDSDLAPINNVFLSTAFADSPNAGVKYSTPEFGGFSGALSFALPSDKSKFTALSAKYASGPVYVGIGYAIADGQYTGGVEAKGMRLNGSYDLGVAKLLATYGNFKVDAASSKATEYEIGVDVPLSGALTLSAGYAQSNLKVAGSTVDKGTSVGMAAAYSLSKRTTVYGGLNNTSFKDGIGNKYFKANVFAVGIKHTF